MSCLVKTRPIELRKVSFLIYSVLKLKDLQSSKLYSLPLPVVRGALCVMSIRETLASSGYTPPRLKVKWEV